MKTFWKYLITLLVGFLGVCGILLSKATFVETALTDFLFHQDILQKSVLKATYQDLCDAFFVIGVVMSGMGLLIFTSNEGAFDMMVYGVRSFFDLFRKNPSKKYPTFYDYQTSRATKKLKFGFMLTCGIFFTAVSLLMYYLYTLYV